MAINPNIALSYRAPEFASPVQMANQMMAFKAAQRENQLAEMQMAEAQRKREQAEQLNALYAQAYNPKTGQVDYGRLRAGAATAGQGSLIPGLVKAEDEAIEQRGKAGKAAADAFTAAMGASKSNLRLDMSPEEYLAWHESNHRDPIIGPYLARLGVTSDTTRPKIIEAINTGRLPDLIRESALGIDKMTEQHFVEQGLGGTSRVLAIPKRGGKAEVVPGSEAAITPSPAEQRRASGADFDPNEVKHVITDERGNVRMFNARGAQIASPGGIGKPSATYEKTQTQREQMKSDIDSTISELKDAVKPGGLIEQSTGSGAGKAFDAVAGFFGQATEGAIAAGSLAPIYDKVLKMVPRFEGPQSDKDTQSYREAAGQLANPAVPNKIKLAAARTILRLMEARRDQFTTQDAIARGETVTTAGDVDLNNPLLK